MKLKSGGMISGWILLISKDNIYLSKLKVCMGHNKLNEIIELDCLWNLPATRKSLVNGSIKIIKMRQTNIQIIS